MHTKVKICGIKTKEEIEIINRYPLDYIGFIFAPSKRQVSIEKAEQLRKQVKKDIKVVGVFVNESLEKVNKAISRCNLEVVQLHGDETVDYCQKVNAPVWKSIRVKDEDSLIMINQYSQVVERILLDTYSEQAKGGTGKTFDWQIVRGISDKQAIVLAGGLTSENILEAIKVVKPQVVDLNSGVETNLIKDEVKINKVFSALKEALII